MHGHDGEALILQVTCHHIACFGAFSRQPNNSNRFGGFQNILDSLDVLILFPLLRSELRVQPNVASQISHCVSVTVSHLLCLEEDVLMRRLPQ